MKILAIDDREDNLIALTAMLQNYVADCEVKTATTGLAGLDLARTYQPDTILLEIQMPGMDGYEVCKLLKNHSVTRHIPIIFLTAQKPNAATQVLALNLGADGFINQPVEPIALAAQVRTMVRIKVAEDALRAEKQALERAVAERTAALQAETTKLDAIFDSSPVAMLVLDKKMSVVRYNAAAAALATGNLAVALPTVVGQGSGRAASDAGSAAPHPDGGQSLSNDSGLSGETPSPQAQHGSAGALPYHQLNGNSLVPTPPPQPGDALGCVHRTEDPRGCGYAPDCRLCTLRQGVESIIAGGAAVHGAELAMDLLRDGRPQKVWLRVGAEHILIAGHRHVVVALDDITERKQAEAALRESEERHRYILQTAMDGFWLADAEGRLLEVNETYSRMSGYSVPELLAMRIPDLEVNETAAVTAAHFHKIMAQGEDRFESRHRRKDGSTFDVEVSVQYRPAEGRRLVAFLRNITARKQAGAALLDAHWRLASIITGTHVGTWEWNVQTGAVVCNERWAEIVGYTLAELAPISVKTWERLAHPEDMKQSVALLERHFAGELPDYDCECRMQHKAGHWVWVHDRGRVITCTYAGQPLMMFGTHTDITERKRAEAALQASNELLTRFIHHSPIYAYIKAVTPTESRVLQASDNFQQMIGSPGTEVVGKTMAELFPADLATHITADDWTVVTKGEVLRLDEQLHGRHYSTIKFPIVQGDKTLLAGYTIDVTERHRAEEALLLSRQQLRALSARLETLREEERTRVAREIHDVLAQELTRLKMDVVWLSRRLARPWDAAQLITVQERLVVMTAVTDTAIQSVQKIATELRPVVLDSLGLCAAVEWQARDFQTRTGIACTATVPEQDVPLDRDRSTAVFRIVQESLTNVLRHAQATQVEILLRPEADQLVLRIQDNGCGIPPETLTNPKSIGLAGMRERALLLDGQLDIRSQPGAGTTIEMRLPLTPPTHELEGKS